MKNISQQKIFEILLDAGFSEDEAREEAKRQYDNQPWTFYLVSEVGYYDKNGNMIALLKSVGNKKPIIKVDKSVDLHEKLKELVPEDATNTYVLEEEKFDTIEEAKKANKRWSLL